MRLIRPVSLLLILVATSVAAIDGVAQTPKHTMWRMRDDSTAISLSVPKHSLRLGESFKARVHFAVRPTWRVFSLKSNMWVDTPALKVRLPDSLLNNFEVTGLRETGRVITAYDSSFEEVRSWHAEPFDLIVTLRAKRQGVSAAQLHLFVSCFATGEKICIPPSWYEVSPAGEIFPRGPWSGDPRYVPASWRAADSTDICLSLSKRNNLRTGECIEARFQFFPHEGWRISNLSKPKVPSIWEVCEGMCQLQVRVPDSLADRFEIVSLKESGDKTVRYDQLCYGYRSYFEGPFEIVAKLKVKKPVRSLQNFKLFAFYQALNELGSIQPLWHEVPLNERESALR